MSKLTKATRKTRYWESKQMTFHEMTKKFGHIMALDILMAVEKMARLTIDEARKKMDKQKRLTSALAELDRLDAVGVMKPAHKASVAPPPPNPRDEALF